MTSVKGRGGDDPHVAVLLGKLLLEVRAALPARTGAVFASRTSGC